ncbi:MAG: hypothetical protein JSU87_11680 [Gemmatimonadota bacterium]|nr:MAG: hypothetical protein JSU87_11680 [Gemmatimonadota bacterium]
MTSWTTRPLIAAGILTLVIAAPASPQSAEDIIGRALDQYERRMSKIENYTVVQEVMGIEVTNYFEKRMVDGRPVFELQDKYGGSEQDELGDMYYAFMDVAKNARVEGKEKVDGRDCHVLLIDDFSGLDMGREGDDDFEPKKGLFYLDTDDYVLRRMVMDGTITADGQQKPVTLDAYFEDYREVAGMLHPFVMRMQMSGLQGSMSQEEIEEARKNLEEMKKQLAEMPESQRAMVEKMMGSQMENLEKMVNQGSMEFTITVKDLQVNKGAPENN